MARAKQSVEEWENALSKEVLREIGIKKMIRDYLLDKGYMESARAFVLESKISVGNEAELLDGALFIAWAIRNGETETALRHIEAHYTPDLLTNNPDLRFQLMRQIFIEHVKAGDIEAALDGNIADFAEQYPQFLPMIEDMCGLAFYESLPPNHPDLHRMYSTETAIKEICREFYSAVSRSSGYKPKDEPCLMMYLKHLTLSEKLLRKEREFPYVDLTTGKLCDTTTSADDFDWNSIQWYMDIAQKPE